MQSNQVISQSSGASHSQVMSSGGTKHKRRRRVRTLKATYGRAYRKYNQMYGGAGEVPDPKKEEEVSPGLFTTLTKKLFGSNEDDAKKKAEEEAAAVAKKKKEEEEAAAAATTAAPEGDGKSLIEKAEDAATGALATVEGKAAEIKDGIVRTTTDLKDRATIAASVLVPSTGDDNAKNAAAMDAVASDAAAEDDDDDNKSVSSNGSSSSSGTSSSSDSDNEGDGPGDGDGPGAAAAATTSSDDDSSLSEDKRRIKELEKKVEMLTTGPLADAARAAKDAAAAVESAMESMKIAAIAANAASAAASAIAISVNSKKYDDAVSRTSTPAPVTTTTPPPPPPTIDPSDDNADAPVDPTSKEFTDAQSLLGKDAPPKGDTLRGLNAEELEPEVKSLEEGNPDVKKGGKNRHKHRKSNHNGTRKH